MRAPRRRGGRREGRTNSVVAVERFSDFGPSSFEVLAVTAPVDRSELSTWRCRGLSEGVEYQGAKKATRVPSDCEAMTLFKAISRSASPSLELKRHGTYLSKLLGVNTVCNNRARVSDVAPRPSGSERERQTENFASSNPAYTDGKSERAADKVKKYFIVDY